MSDFTNKKQQEYFYAYSSEGSGNDSPFYKLSTTEDHGLNIVLVNKVEFFSEAHKSRLKSGFYRLDDGKHRWMSKKGDFLADIMPNDRYFILEGYVPSQLLTAGNVILTIFLNRQKLGEIKIDCEGVFCRAVMLNGILDTIVRHKVLISIEASHVFVPAEQGNNENDRRELSIIVNKGGFSSANVFMANTEGPARVTEHPYFDGDCVICGQAARFEFDNWSLHRESFVCPHCGATNRNRQLARGMLVYLAKRGFCYESIRALAVSDDLVSLNILDTDAHYAVSNALKKKKFYWISEYLPQYPWGKVLGERCSNQNLEKLAYKDCAFDLVLAGDVLEHVRLYKMAIKEIYRVLRPGGAFVFTVPFISQQYENKSYVEIGEDIKNDSLIGDAVYHEDSTSGEGALLYRIFGRQLLEELESVGFVVHYSHDTIPLLGIYECELFYCVKPMIGTNDVE